MAPDDGARPYKATAAQPRLLPVIPFTLDRHACLEALCRRLLPCLGCVRLPLGPLRAFLARPRSPALD